MLQVFAVFVHGPEVHGAVAVGEEEDAVIGDHGAGAGAVEIGGEVNSFRFTIEGPDLFDEAAFIAFCFGALVREAGEEQGAAVVVGAERSLPERDRFSDTGCRVQFDQLRGRQLAVAAAAVEDFAVWGKSGDVDGVAIEVVGKSFRYAAIDGHAIEFVDAFVFSREYEGCAIG
ncbi:hypothetical protein [Flavihumibacter fluvii]|uniref:hypothetical protein n=1 Tax=Flavihumibacter fluvii TaxID=2838157 RepID=UPI001EFAD02A|nr:hypothetical protein [Flavihumibacter fluvii]ULQ53343.1 hypothetical protein KJS93_03305 [Flavihumibacter fluvii]